MKTIFRVAVAGVERVHTQRLRGPERDAKQQIIFNLFARFFFV